MEVAVLLQIPGRDKLAIRQAWTTKFDTPIRTFFYFIDKTYAVLMMLHWGRGIDSINQQQHNYAFVSDSDEW